MPVVLVFAKEPRPGRVKTRLAAGLGPERACDLYRAFLADLARALAAPPPDTRVEWWVDGDPETVRAETGPAPAFFRQPPGDLGE
ncbi:MAG: hypothetical protein SCH98_06845, partial [Deferrisomatales bacterium]|nr:hypothetical protein [Deferrisomatales bacterium]